MNFHSSNIKNISLYKLQMFHLSPSPSFPKEGRAGGISEPSSSSYWLTGCVCPHSPLSPYSIISLSASLLLGGFYLFASIV